MKGGVKKNKTVSSSVKASNLFTATSALVALVAIAYSYILFHCRSSMDDFCLYYPIQVFYRYGHIDALSLTEILLAMVRLPYYDSRTELYSKGLLDITFITSGMLILTALQHLHNLLCDRLLSSSWKQKPKFAEQSFLFLYYIFSMSFDLYVYYHSPYFPANTRELWTDYPVHRLQWSVKFYYLITGAFWTQQLLTYLFFIPRNERRKDHLPMTIHHAVTSMLVLGSYMAHCTRVGNVVLIVMDTADVFLTLAKCLKYLKFQLLCDITFGLFALSWLITRHVIFFVLMWTIIFEAPHILEKYSDYDPYFTRKMVTGWDWDRPGTYFSIPNWAFFVACFVILQTLLIFWFTMILRVIAKVIAGGTAEDEREDDD